MSGTGPGGRDGPDRVEGLLRELAPRTLAILVRRRGHMHFADAEDAAQEALVAAADKWPAQGIPDRPLGWLVRVASRRMIDLARSDEARRRREDLAQSRAVRQPEPASARDDTLVLFFMCCHPSLPPASAVALTLRALGGLTTREIATAFLVPEATMAQRISRAKRTVAGSGEPFSMPEPDELGARLDAVLRVVFLVFNEGYATSGGPDVFRADLAGEAIRLGRLLHELVPDDPEVAALLALLVLTEARRPARTGPDGSLIPLAEQDRTLWDRGLITEGTALLTAALRAGPLGEYAALASVAALHDAAPCAEDTDWSRILALYTRLETLTGSPVVRLNRAVALAMVEGPAAGLAALDAVGADAALARSHRLHAVRAHLLEMDGHAEAARAEYAAAAARAGNRRERDYLTVRAARLHRPAPGPAAPVAPPEPA